MASLSFVSGSSIKRDPRTLFSFLFSTTAMVRLTLEGFVEIVEGASFVFVTVTLKVFSICKKRESQSRKENKKTNNEEFKFKNALFSSQFRPANYK